MDLAGERLALLASRRTARHVSVVQRVRGPFPALTREWRLSETAAGWLTLSVANRFVVSTLLSALFNLPDIIRPRHLFTVRRFAARSPTPHLDGSRIAPQSNNAAVF